MAKIKGPKKQKAKSIRKATKRHPQGISRVKKHPSGLQRFLTEEDLVPVEEQEEK